MADTQEQYTVERYLKGMVPNVRLSDDSLIGVMVDAGIEPGTEVSDLTQKQKDLALAYMYIRLATSPSTSSRITDRDADWEHSEGSEQWTAYQLQQFLILARKLLEKWKEDTTLIDDLIPEWGFTGRGIRNPRKY